MVNVTGTLPGPCTAGVSGSIATAAAPATKGAAAEAPVILRKSRRDKPEVDDGFDLRFFFFSGRSSTERPPCEEMKRLGILTLRGQKEKSDQYQFRRSFSAGGIFR